MKLLYVRLRNISSRRGGFFGAGTCDGTAALNTPASLLPTIRSQITSIFTEILTGSSIRRLGRGRLMLAHPRGFEEYFECLRDVFCPPV